MTLLLAACGGDDTESEPDPDGEEAPATDEDTPEGDDEAEGAAGEPLCPVYSLITNDVDNERAALWAIQEGLITSDIIGELDVTYTTIPGLIAAMGTGEYNLNYTSAPGVVLAREFGELDLRVVGFAIAHAGDGQRMYVREDSDIESPEDLVGKTLGVGAFGSSATLWTRAILSERYGLNTEIEGGDIDWVELDPPTLVAALQSGDVDAADLFHNTGWEAREDPDLRVLLETDNEWNDLFGDWPLGAAYVAEVDELEETGECAKEFRRMLLESVAYVEENTEEVAASVASIYDIPEEFMEYWWGGSHLYGGGIEEEWLDRAQVLWDAGEATGQLPVSPDVRELIFED